MYMALVQHHFIYSYSASAAPFHGAYAAPFHTALLQHRFTWRLCSTMSYSAYAAPFHVALVQHHFIWRLCSTVSRGAYAAPLSFINYFCFNRIFWGLWHKADPTCGQEFGQTWTLGHLDHSYKEIVHKEHIIKAKTLGMKTIYTLFCH